MFRRAGLSILRERAAIGYRHRQYEAATDRHSPYRKMLAALWRESPVPGLEPGRRLATMASLLHVDRAGRSFAGALIAESGLAPAAWLRRYLDAYLVPLLHSLYAYDLAFMPHGENVILVLHTGAVERVIFKDIAEEIVVMDRTPTCPSRYAGSGSPSRSRTRSCRSSPTCSTASCGTSTRSWPPRESSTRRRSGGRWPGASRTTPHLADRLHRHDLFAPEFALSCLNRLQLRDNQQMLDLADPSGSLQFVGTLANPLARFAPDRVG